VVICLERGADLHTAQLMPLPLTVSCFCKIQIGLTFLVPAHPGSPGKGLLNGCVCVCVSLSVQYSRQYIQTYSTPTYIAYEKTRDNLKYIFSTRNVVVKKNQDE